jgi:hypothetical protein
MFLIDVVAAQPLPGRRLALTFKDGLSATVDMDAIVGTYRGVFAPLLDSTYFDQVRVDPDAGTVVWPNGADVCPDVLYSYASGVPIVVDGVVVLDPGTSHVEPAVLEPPPSRHYH